MTPDAPKESGRPDNDRYAGIHQLALAIRDRWATGEKADTRAAIDEHPELLENASAVVDLVYDEYWQRRLAGEPVKSEEFIARYPGLRSRLVHMFSTDRYLENHPSAPDKFQPSKPEVEWPAPGQVWGDFTLIRELGRGALARVYLATEASTGDRHVAVKLSSLDTAEGCTLGRLHHDHIVPVHWARHDPVTGWYVICMPFLGAATVEHLLFHLYGRPGAPPPGQASALLDAVRRSSSPDDPPPEENLAGPKLDGLSFVEGVRRLAVPLADTLAFLHGRQLYHCDLKPSNILLTPAGRPLLLDFNLSQAARVAPGRIGGTFPYIAPEQIHALLSSSPLSGEQAAGADLFSLGVVLFELLTGRLPFGAPSPEGNREEMAAETLRLQEAGCPPIRQLNPDVPPELAEVLDSCLSLDPAGRPASAAQLARRLEVAQPQPLPERPRSRRVPLLASITGALVLIALLLLGWVLLRSPGLEPDLLGSLRVQGHQQLADGRQRAVKDPLQAHETLRSASDTFGRVIDMQRKAGTTAGLWRDYYARGRARLLMGDANEAMNDFLEANDLRASEHRLSSAVAFCGVSNNPLNALGLIPPVVHPSRDARIAACRAWCLARTGSQREALLLGHQALDAGFRSPGLLNNLAYSHLQRGQFDQARRYLAEALRRQPDLVAGLRNRAVADLRAFQNPAPSTGKHPLPAAALADIERAIALAQKAGQNEPNDLYLQACSLYSCTLIEARKQETRLRRLAAEGPLEPAQQVQLTWLREEIQSRAQRAKEYLERAFVLGRDPSSLAHNPLITQALGKPDINRLVRLPRQHARPTWHAYLVDPLPDSVE